MQHFGSFTRWIFDSDIIVNALLPLHPDSLLFRYLSYLRKHPVKNPDFSPRNPTLCTITIVQYIYIYYLFTVRLFLLLHVIPIAGLLPYLLLYVPYTTLCIIYYAAAHTILLLVHKAVAKVSKITRMTKRSNDRLN